MEIAKKALRIGLFVFLTFNLSIAWSADEAPTIKSGSGLSMSSALSGAAGQSAIQVNAPGGGG